MNCMLTETSARLGRKGWPRPYHFGRCGHGYGEGSVQFRLATSQEFEGTSGFSRARRILPKIHGEICQDCTPSVLRKINSRKEVSIAFEQLKEAMVTAPVLAIPNFQYQFVPETYVSGHWLGVLLLENQHL